MFVMLTSTCAQLYDISVRVVVLVFCELCTYREPLEGFIVLVVS